MPEVLHASSRSIFAPLEQVLRKHGASEAMWASKAPGRVNLIGDHTDYSQGLALPMGIDLCTLALAAPRSDGAESIRILSTQEGDATLPLSGDAEPTGDWTDYLRGVLNLYQQRGIAVPAMDVVIGGDLPLGAGLSSSASLELCFATLIEAASGEILAPRERALLCQQAEHDFAGVPCGILDQFAVSFAKEGTAMLLDCREQSIETVYLPPTLNIAIIDSGVRHALGDGGYAERRAQVERAQTTLEKSLRDTTAEDLESLSDEIVRKRAQHVVSENARVQAFATALSEQDMGTAGQLMYASHESLARDFAVSCPELDVLVDAAKEAGALGARMTGGGFGGSVVAFLGNEDKRDFEDTVIRRFSSAGYAKPVIRWISAAAGADAWRWT